MSYQRSPILSSVTDASLTEQDAYYWPIGAGCERPAYALDVRRLTEIVVELLDGIEKTYRWIV